MNKKNIEMIVMQYAKSLDGVEKYKRMIEESQHKIDNFIGDVDYEVEKREDLMDIHSMYESESDDLFNDLLKEVSRYEFGKRMKRVNEIMKKNKMRRGKNEN